LDLRSGPNGEFRWFDMVWEGFGDRWDFDEESTETSHMGSYTGSRYDLHQVMFQLELKTSEDEIIRFRKTSGTNTTTIAKAPVRFLVSDVQGSIEGQSENIPWDNGHQIKEIRLTVRSVQLRSPQNNVWPGVNADRNCNFDDMWIVSFTAELAMPPVPIVLYENQTWNPIIKNPKWGHGDAAFGLDANDATILPAIPATDGTPNRIVWDPIDITVTDTDKAQYSALVVTVDTNIPWFGFGPISLRNTEPVIAMDFDSGGTNPPRIPLDSVAAYGTSNYFNKEQFIGFFIQGNQQLTSLLITKIVLE